MGLPGETHTRLESVVHIGLQGSPAINMRGSKPIASGGVGGWISDGVIEAGFIVMDFVPAVIDLIAQAQIEREVGAHLPVILNENLGRLEAGSVFGRDTGIPIVRIAEKKVGVF